MDDLRADARALVQHTVGCERCKQAMRVDDDDQPQSPETYCPQGRALVIRTRAAYARMR